MQIDLDAMRQIAENMYVPHVQRHFGSPGVDALRHLVSTLRRIYREIDPSLHSGRLLVVVRPSDIAGSIQLGTPDATIQPSQAIRHHLDGDRAIEARFNGRLDIHTALPDGLALSREAIVYIYRDRVEQFFVGGEVFTVPNPSPAAMASIFARPTFSSLDAALTRYATEVVNKTVCFILAHEADGIWHDKNRLFLRAKPEEVMRRSLHQFLRDAFPDAEVRPEQIVDESHPVDIKVTWADTTHRAIIEIKWIGVSVDSSGKITTRHHNARANDGAKQLREYLDSDGETAAHLRTRGYLVVFDARRRGLAEGQTSVTSENGLYYRDKEIVYKPDFSVSREDFSSPVRMFAEPRLS